MAEYTEKQAALKAVCDACGIIPDRGKENCQYKVAGCKEYYNVFVLPPADVRPVVRGKWLHEDSASNYLAYKCSVCGTGGRLYKFSFCSQCGADMRGGDADGDTKD